MAQRNETPRLPTTLIEGRELPPPPQTSFYTSPVPVISMNVPDQLQQILIALKSTGTAFDELGTFYARSKQSEQRYTVMRQGLGADMATDDVAVVKRLPTDWNDPVVARYAPPDEVHDSQLPAWYAANAASLLQTDDANIVAGFRQAFVPAAVEAAIQMRTKLRSEQRDHRIGMFVKGVVAGEGIPSREQAFDEIYPQVPNGQYGDAEREWVRENWNDTAYADSVLIPAAQLAFDKGNYVKSSQLLAASAASASPDKWGTLEAKLREKMAEKEDTFIKTNIQALHFMLDNPTGSTMDSRTKQRNHADQIATSVGRTKELGQWNEARQRDFIISIDSVLTDNELPIDDRIAFAMALVDGEYTQLAIPGQPPIPVEGEIAETMKQVAAGAGSTDGEIDESVTELQTKRTFSPDEPVVTEINKRIDRLMLLRERESEAIKNVSDARNDQMTNEIMLFFASPQSRNPQALINFTQSMRQKYGDTGAVAVRKIGSTDANAFRDDNAVALLDRLDRATDEVDLKAIRDDALFQGTNGMLSPQRFKEVTEAMETWRTGSALRKSVDVKELRDAIEQSFDAIEDKVALEGSSLAINPATGGMVLVKRPESAMRKAAMLRDFDREVNLFIQGNKTTIDKSAEEAREKLLDHLETRFSMEIIEGYNQTGKRRVPTGKKDS